MNTIKKARSRHFFKISFIILGIGLLLLSLGKTNAMDKGLNTKAFIMDYQAVWIPLYDPQHNLLIAIRYYYLNKTPYFLTVNTATLSTQAIPAKDFRVNEVPTINGEQAKYISLKSINNTPYLQALNQYTSSYPLQNAGLIHAGYPINGMFLTIDMCPSKKMFEVDFFKALVAMSEQTKQAVPITLSISGLWMLTHTQEFNWLMTQKQNQTLDITWMNHSFSHVYYHDPNLPLEKNFMLNNPNHFIGEVLNTEKILLENQQIPSIFFRFPGLISDKALILNLKKLGLIPVGSNAWLAKGEKPQAGSIILVHGNSNEHSGIVDIMKLLDQPRWPLLPLSQAIVPI